MKSKEIEYYKLKGKALIYSERLDKWHELIDKVAHGNYNGKDMEMIVFIMEKLQSGADADKLAEIVKKNFDSSLLFSAVIQVMEFSKRGTEFFRAYFKDDNEMMMSYFDYLQKVNDENFEYEKNLKAKNSDNSL